MQTCGLAKRKLQTKNLETVNADQGVKCGLQLVVEEELKDILCFAFVLLAYLQGIEGKNC